MSEPLQRVRESAPGSRTMTVSPVSDENEAGPSQSTEPPVGVLRLRGGPARRQRVMWTEETVDNEGMGKKKSKICCIYHKPRAYDESSSESSSSEDDEPSKSSGSNATRKARHGRGAEVEDESSESEGGAGDGRPRPMRSRRKAHRHSHGCDHGHGKHDGGEANKYDHKPAGTSHPKKNQQ